MQSVIIGIGINLTTDYFPDELIGIAGSVGQSINRCKMIADIYKRIKAFCNELTNCKFMDDYRKYSLVIGKSISFTRNGTDYIAFAESITDKGELIVKLENGESLILNSGEISIRL